MDSEHPFLIPRLSIIRETCMLATIVCTQVIVLAGLAQGIFPDVAIGRTLGTDGSTESLWGPAAYGLTSGAFMLPAGRIGDMYGHRSCYIGAWVWMALASFLTGISAFYHSFVFYAVCRGLQGMAAAMLVPCALAILALVYKEGPRKNLAFSLFAAGSPVGFTLGGLFSGLIEAHGWWPWIFWATSIACGSLVIGSLLSIPKLHEFDKEPEQQAQSISTPEKASFRRDFDWVGTLIGVSGLVLFNVAWNLAPEKGWNAPSTITTVIIGLILLAAFPFVELRVRQPLVPIGRLSSKSLFVLAVIACIFASFGILIFYLVNFIIRLRNGSALEAAAQFVPISFAGLAASYLNSFLLKNKIQPASILSFSCIWFIVGNVLLATMPANQTYWAQAFWANVLSPLGIDLSFPSATLLMSQLVPPKEQGIAASLIATVVYYSQSIGLGIAGTVETRVADGSLMKGYRGAFYTGIGLSTLGFLLSLWPVLQLHLDRKK